MKANLKTAQSHLSALGAAVVAILGLFTQASPAQNSPLGTWDFVLTGPGGQQGVAVMSFVNPTGTNRSFFGYEQQSTKPAQTPDPKDGDASRNNGGDETRNGFVSDGSSSTNTPGGSTNLFGFGPVSGPWEFDSKGRVIGFFTELIGVTTVFTNWANCVQGVLVTTNVTVGDQSATFDHVVNLGCYTNATPTTNVVFVENTPFFFVWSVSFTSTNPIVTSISGEATNAVSFVAKVVSGKRMTLTASTSFGKVTYRGVPSKPGKDLSGDWQGYKRANNQDFLQLFALVSGTAGNPFTGTTAFDNITNFPNIYFTTNGQGPGYTFNGFVVQTVQKKVGFTFLSDVGGNSSLSSTYGGLKTSSKATKVNTKGNENPFLDISFKADKTIP